MWYSFCAAHITITTSTSVLAHTAPCSPGTWYVHVCIERQTDVTYWSQTGTTTDKFDPSRLPLLSVYWSINPFKKVQTGKSTPVAMSWTRVPHEKWTLCGSRAQEITPPLTTGRALSMALINHLCSFLQKKHTSAISFLTWVAFFGPNDHRRRGGEADGEAQPLLWETTMETVKILR